MPQHQPVSTPVSFTRLARLLVLSLLALFFTGCLDYKEEMWLKEDGSGKLNATMTLNMQMLEGMGNMGLPADPGTGTTTTTTATPEPPGMDSEEFRKKLEGKEGLRVIKVDSTQEGGKFSLSWEVEFDNLAALAALDESDGEADFTTGQGSPGGMYKDISWQNVGGKMVYSRAVGEQPAAGGAPADAMSMSMASMMFAGAAMDFTVHFPGEVSATSGNVVEGEKKTAHWNIPFSQIMQGRTSMTAEVKPAGSSIPWLWVGIAAFIVFDFIVMALILAWVMKRRREQAATPVTGSSSRSSARRNDDDDDDGGSPGSQPHLRTPDDDFRPR